MKRILFAASLLCCFIAARAAQPAKIEWQPWSDSIFAKAKKEHRFVLLDLEAVWCHWCHVMDEVTYSDPKVIALIDRSYLPLKVDQDSRPDLSNRYEDYGWPATVVFNADGGEIVRRQGYIPPKPMASMLQAIIDDPSPGPSIVAEVPEQPSNQAGLTKEQRDKLRMLLQSRYDAKNKGWGTTQKYLDWDIVEYCMEEGEKGDKDFARLGRETLDAQQQLIDPIWGGVYQYSTDGDWKHPHFEKIMQMQAEDLRIYSIAYKVWKDPAYLTAADNILKYLRGFLTSPEGAFYTSQDADLIDGRHSADYFALSDADRRKHGVPRVDQHLYTRENAWAINALATYYSGTADKKVLDEAIRAANWLLSQRHRAEGGFHHGDSDDGKVYLGDQIYAARAFLKLYEVTADRSWLTQADEALNFIEKTFKSDVGFSSYTELIAKKLKPKPQVDENVAVARVASLLWSYTGKESYKEMAQHAMRYLAAPATAARRGHGVAGILLADRQLSVPPLHVTVVGSKSDEKAQALFLSAIGLPETYKRVEWFDKHEGTLPNNDVEFPEVDSASAFVCTDRRCSAPISDPAKIASFASKK